MAELTEEQARVYMHKLLAGMSQAGGSDLFIAADFPPSIKAHGRMRPLAQQKLTGDVTRKLAHAMMNERQREEFAKELECNFAVSIPGVSRFRVNVYVQQQHVGMVIRTIANEIPQFEKLGLPPVLKEIIMAKRGLVLVVGGTGVGQIDFAGGAHRSPQSHERGPHHHGRRPRRVRAPLQAVAGHALRSRGRYPVVAPGA